MNDIFKVYDFENEQQWLKGRMNGIGGSDASAVVGMNPYKSNIDLFEEKIGRVMPKDISDKPCVIYGKNAEEYIRELFKLDYPEYTVDHHEFRILQSKDHPFMQASLDGELTDREGRKGILEMHVEVSEGFRKTIADIVDCCVEGNTNSCTLEVEVRENASLVIDMKFEVKEKKVDELQS